MALCCCWTHAKEMYRKLLQYTEATVGNNGRRADQSGTRRISFAPSKNPLKFQFLFLKTCRERYKAIKLNAFLSLFNVWIVCVFVNSVQWRFRFKEEIRQRMKIEKKTQQIFELYSCLIQSGYDVIVASMFLHLLFSLQHAVVGCCCCLHASFECLH